MKTGKKIIASALCFALVAPLGGCAFFDKDDQGVIDAAEAYCTAVSQGKVSKICDLLVNGRSLKSEIESYISGSEFTTYDGYEDVVAAIAGTITYEVDAESVMSSRKNEEGSINVEFSMVDYDAVYRSMQDCPDEASFIEAVTAEDAERIVLGQTLDLVLENDVWLVEDPNLNRVFSVYEFYSDALSYTFIPRLFDYIDHDVWYYSENGVYSNVNTIELDIIPTDAGSNILFEFTYEYYLNGQLIYTSDVCTDQGYWIESYYGPSIDANAQTDSNGLLVAGEYECIVYDMAGRVLADSTCTVEYEEEEAASDLIDYIEWFYSENDVYTDVTQIELDIIPTSGTGQSIIWTFMYEYYRDGELIFVSDLCTDQGYWIESYYGPWYDPGAEVTENGYLVPGEYRCIVYDISGNMIADSTCMVEVT